MKVPTNGCLATSGQGERKPINSELWHACAGPLVALPPVGSLVVYFPQGHSEQVAASMRKKTDCIPSYPNLPSKLICMLQNVTLHADPETDEVYAQMTLQPVSKYDKEAVLASDIGLKQNRQPAEFFYKALTASDTSTHGGFSVPRRAAEKIFPPLHFSMQPPAQELVARDLHDSAWTFRHIYRGQPKRHLLTTGWSVFVSTKRLFAGDSVLFIRDERSELLLGLRRANRQLPGLSSSVISSDSMHIGILAAAAHASANNSSFTIFYNPRASPCEFVIPLAKYNKAMYAQVSLGMRFRMMFETEESGVRRHMGTVTGVTELDPVRWKGSQWRNLQVGWDESTAGERPTRVSIWDIEPVVTPFYICPPPFIRPKFPKQSGIGDEFDLEKALKRGMPWMGDDYGIKDATNSVFPGLSLVQWMNMQQGNHIPAAQAGMFPSTTSSTSLHNTINTDDPSKLLSFQTPVASAQNFQFNIANHQNQVGQFQQAPMTRSQQPPQQQAQQTQPQQQPPPLVQQTLVNSGINKNPNEITQQAGMYSQVPQQQVVAISRGNQSQQSIQAANMNSFNFSPIPQESKIQQQMEQQSNSLSQRHQQQPQMQLDQSHVQFLQQNMSSQRPAQQSQMQQLSQQSLAEQQIQPQLQRKLQQQRQQPQEQPQLPHQQSQPRNQQSQHEVYQQMLPKQQVYQQNLQPQQQQQQLNENSLLTPAFMNSQQYPPNQLYSSQRWLAANRAQSAHTDGDVPSRSTSPSTNNCHSSTSNFQDRNPKAPTTFTGDATTEFASNLVKDIKTTPDTHVPNQLKSKGNVTDQFEGSSSATSHRLEAGSVQQSFSVPSLLDGDVQSNQRNNFPYAGNVNGLTADTLLSRGYDSSKDLQNLFCNYGNNPQDFETEFSTAINSQPFGVPDLSFKDGCVSEVAMNGAGVLSGGIWANQTQRLRTYTKVQKRGSVGRSIDVTRYIGYDELKQDLAHMFGIEGQLDDPQRTDWKLVYVDHENDILLVGDDPWEEFVSCVQSIKILSFAEVQQLSLDGDLGNVPVPTNQARSGTESGIIFKGNYDDHSATSFNR